jgi:hypothetical protein
MQSRDIIFIGSGLITAYLVFNSLKINKKLNDLEILVGSMNSQLGQASLDQKNNAKLGSEVIEAPIAEKIESRVRLNEMPLYTRN